MNLDLAVDVSPVLCALFAGQTPAQLAALLGPAQAQLISLLSGGTESCPASGSVHSPLGTAASGKGSSLPSGSTDGLAWLLRGGGLS